MKRFSCFGLRALGHIIASIDIILAITLLALCSFYLYNDLVQMALWPEDEVQILSPLSTLIATVVDYVLVNNFSSAFYMTLAGTLCIKALINLVVASLLIDGIRKQRLICIAPWIINTGISVFAEVAIFIFMEIKMEEVDASEDRRIVRSIVFGVIILFNGLFALGIHALYKMLKVSTSENRELQESIVETAGLFQHVKV